MAHLFNGVLWSAVATLAVFVGAFLLAQLGLSWETPDEFTYDWRTALLSKVPMNQRQDIGLVLIDDASIAQYWSRSPVDRGLIAELVKAVDAVQPKAIGLDFIFDRHSEPSKDAALRDAIRNAVAPVILGVTTAHEGPLTSDNLQWQDEFVASTATQTPPRAGTLFFGEPEEKLTLGDNVVRNMGAALADQIGKYDKTFDLLLAQQKEKKSIEIPHNRLIAWLLRPKQKGADTFATLHVPEHAPVDGHGDGHTVLPNSLSDVLTGKIVIIGADFIDRDQHRIPLSIETKAPVPGAFIHAQIVAQLIDDRKITELPKFVEVVLVFFMCLAGYLIASRYSIFAIEMFSQLVFLLTITVVGGVLFWIWTLVLPTSTMFMGWLFGAIGEGHGAPAIAVMKAAGKRIHVASKMRMQKIADVRKSISMYLQRPKRP
jgi:adenylate cyclase